MALTGGKRREQRPVSFDSEDVSIGDFLTYAGDLVFRNVVVAFNASIDTNSGFNVILGYGGKVGTGSYGNMMISPEGYSNSSIGDGSNFNLAAGTSPAVGNSCYGNLLLGPEGTVIIGNDSRDNVCLGSNVRIGNSCGDNIVITPDGNPDPGGLAAGNGSNFNIIMGYCYAGSNNNGNVLMGGQTNTGNNCFGLVEVGQSIYSWEGSTLCHAVGRNINMGVNGTNAFGSLETAGPGQFVDNDYITFPDGSGGTINVEIQTTNAFVPTPGMFTADLRGAGSSLDVAGIIRDVALPNTTLQNYGDGPQGIGWQVTYGYPTIGTAGNGQQIVPHVANGAAAAVGSTFSGGNDITPATHCNAFGEQLTFGRSSDSSTLIGTNSSIGDNSSRSTVMGSGYLTLGPNSPFTTMIGTSHTLGDGCSQCTTMGNELYVYDHSHGVVEVGIAEVCGTNQTNIVAIGSLIFFGNAGNTHDNNVAIGVNFALGSLAPRNAYLTFQVTNTIANLNNNDWLSFPDGSGGTLEVELWVSDPFVPFGPPRLVADVRGLLNSGDVANAIAAVVLANTTLTSYNSGTTGAYFTYTFNYPVPGPAGNGFTITPTALVLGALLGSTSQGGMDADGTNRCTVIGSSDVLFPSTSENIVISDGTFVTGSRTIVIGRADLASNVVPKGINDDSVLIGRSTLGFDTARIQVLGRFAIGEQCADILALGSGTVGAGVGRSVVIGPESSVDPGLSFHWDSVAIGSQAQVKSGYSNAIGAGCTTEGNTDGATVIGYYAHAIDAHHAIALGIYVQIESDYGIAIGGDARIYPDAEYSTVVGKFAYVNSPYNLALGYSTAISTDSPYAIAIGGSFVNANSPYSVAIGRSASVLGGYGLAFGASASANASEAVLGHSTATEALHTFVVRGYNGGVLDTISAIDNPADQCFGLSIVWNNAGSFSNKTIKGAVSPPVGSILLYADPP